MKVKWHTQLFIICILCFVLIAGCGGKENAELNSEGHESEVIDPLEQDEDVIVDLPVDGDHIDDSNDDSDEETEEIDEEDVINEWIEAHGLTLGNMYPVHGATTMHEVPDNIYQGHITGETKPGQNYILHEFYGDLVKVFTADISGWVSAWYFTEEAKGVAKVEPYEMIVESPVFTAYYPGGSTEEGLGLDSGKVVKVNKKYKDWVSVAILWNNTLNDVDLWIHTDNLIAYDPALATEGILKAGGKVYDKGGRVTDSVSIFSLGITGEKDNMFSIWAPGGKEGYILKEDFEPNPFAQPVLTMTYAVNEALGTSYIVETLTEHTVTHRYFDSNNNDGAEDEASTITFESMLMRQNGQRLYTINLWLTYPMSGVQLQPTVDLIDQIETNREFRKMFGQMLDKPFYKVTNNLVITTEMVMDGYKAMLELN